MLALAVYKVSPASLPRRFAVRENTAVTPPKPRYSTGFAPPCGLATTAGARSNWSSDVRKVASGGRRC
jgi:hypothetical protein